MPVPYPRVREPDTIDTLALKHLQRHPNDKSNSILAKMNRRYGKVASNEALHKMKRVAKLLQIETPADPWKAPKVIQPRHPPLKWPTLKFIDEASDWSDIYDRFQAPFLPTPKAGEDPHAGQLSAVQPIQE